ncbi:MAG: CsgG/HfaB family protein [Candidatus Binatia bacterium]
MKPGIALFALAAVIGGCAAKPAAAPPGASGAAVARATTAAEARRRQTIAVYPFENNAVTGRERLDFLREWLPDVVGEALRQGTGLRLVERRELLRILQEQKLGASALASKEGRIELGKIAGAQTLVFGGFTAIADRLQIDARIVDAESSLVLRSVTVHGAAGKARDLGAELAGKVAENLGLEVSRRTTGAGVTDSRALRAAELYYDGVSLEKAGKKEQAIERYRQVLEIDRGDEEARARLRKLLGGSP